MDRRRTQFTVSWPIQGIACFRSDKSELVLSDVYWRWIVDTLTETIDKSDPFFVAWESGFRNPYNLVETMEMTAHLQDLLQEIAPSTAPSFGRVIPSPGCRVPSASQVLNEFIRVVDESVLSGSMEMEIE